MSDRTHPGSPLLRTPTAPENGSPGADWNEHATRRRFLLNTGKAGAVTILTFHGLKVEVVAGTPSGAASM